MNRDRFPGLAGDWARLDGPAGTQMVDVAIEAGEAVAVHRPTTPIAASSTARSRS